jgi:cation diffusion facilitator family transporter
MMVDSHHEGFVMEEIRPAGQQQLESMVVSPIDSADPLSLSQYKTTSITRSGAKTGYLNSQFRKVEHFYSQQNDLINQFLQSSDEERLDALDAAKNGGKVKFAVYASFAVNSCLFVIQLYAAVSTGSLSLFATAADAFMDLVSSVVMLVTSRMAARAKPYNYPVGRRRIETVGVILFCALMTTVAIQLIIESGRSLGQGSTEAKALMIVPLTFVGLAIFSKFCLFLYCFTLRRYPAAHVFFIDHRNDLVVNVFGLIMSVVGDRFVWYLDPIGAICIALLILFSWVSTAFENVWLLVGKSAPQDFLNKCVYVALTHDVRIEKIDTVSSLCESL